jgi:hypothetical protein
MPTPAGWYPDPELPATQRYWDGAAWTEHRAPRTVAAPRKSNAGTIVAIIGFVLAALIIGPSLLGLFRLGGSGGTESETTTQSVVYEFAGTAVNGSITYGTPTGQEQKDIALPGSISYRTDGTFQTWTSLVQNMGDSGEVTCRIKVDGRVVAENTSSAAYGIATCSSSTD